MLLHIWTELNILQQCKVCSSAGDQIKSLLHGIDRNNRRSKCLQLICIFRCNIFSNLRAFQVIQGLDRVIITLYDDMTIKGNIRIGKVILFLPFICHRYCIDHGVNSA